MQIYEYLSFNKRYSYPIDSLERFQINEN